MPTDPTKCTGLQALARRLLDGRNTDTIYALGDAMQRELVNRTLTVKEIEAFAYTLCGSGPR